MQPGQEVAVVILYTLFDYKSLSTAATLQIDRSVRDICCLGFFLPHFVLWD